MSTQKSRTDRLMSKTNSEDLEAWRSVAEEMIDSENQRLWALYTALDVSQRDVKEMVNPLVETSQSTVSRVIRQKKTAVNHDEEALDLVGEIHEETEIHPDEWIEAYQQVLADAKTDLIALKEIINHETQTPEWAARRFPELVGCHHYAVDCLDEKEEIADDSYLNRLESVNTGRWK